MQATSGVLLSKSETMISAAPTAIASNPIFFISSLLLDLTRVIRIAALEAALNGKAA